MNGTTSNQIRYALQETRKALAYFQDEIQKDPLDLASERNAALAVMVLPRAMQHLLNAVEALFEVVEEEENA